MPISMLDRSANGTSRVTSSHSSTAKLHMSAERLLISSGFFCKAAGKPAWGGLKGAEGKEGAQRLEGPGYWALTFWCHPGWCVHPPWALEGELHVSHADPCCLVLVDLGRRGWSEGSLPGPSRQEEGLGHVRVTLTMMLRLLRWWRGMRGSKVCRKAMPRAMSKANFTACIWSTTKSAGREVARG